MLPQEFCFSKTLNPFPIPNLLLPKLPTLSLTLTKPKFLIQNASSKRDPRAFAGRSKKPPSPSRIEGDSDLRREIRRRVRRRAQKYSESFFYRLKNPNKIHADNFTEDQLNLIGLGYDRLVRFMEKDDPNLRHPYDWYKYGEFGPYSWRGVVIGDPVPGGITDECVSFYSETKSQEDWEKIEQFEMSSEFGERLKQMDKSVGFRHYWVFVRHPKWRINDKPWEQWTLASEVVLEAGKGRVDKWSLMSRLGNKARKLITQCAAWFRPDIVYVKRPVYQCRFEPQDEFFRKLVPFLDPKTERNILFELMNEDGSVQWVTYFEGLCKIVKVSQKAFVDDVVNAYEKMSEERKSMCLEFLLTNHPVQLLHPYTKEWKAKLEEMEMGCDAPDEEDEGYYNKDENEFVEWIEDDREGNDREDVVMEMEEGDDGVEAYGEEEGDDDENESYWEEKLRKEVNSAEEMEKMVTKSVERTTKFYEKQLREMEEMANMKNEDDGDETALRGVRAKVSPEEWKIAGIGRWHKRIKKGKIPPELFLPAAVRPFTYGNLVKEIVLTRHAILDGEIGRKEE